MTYASSGEWLDGELARREDAEGRIATSLIELERHPGHQLLSGIAPTGRTGERWASAQVALAGLWQNFEIYRNVVHTARIVRDRRSRPGELELAELRRLLVAPSIEVARTAVALPERGLTGDVERVETITLDELGRRMDAAFAEVSDIVVTCDAVHRAFLTALLPPAERLRDARRLLTELDIGASEPDAVAVAALTARVSDLDRAASTDPLSLADGPPAEVLAALDTEIDVMTQRLAGYAALHDRWDSDVSTLADALPQLDALRGEAERVRLRAEELVAGPVPALPPDQLPRLRATLAALDQESGWPARAAALSAIRRAVDTATADLRAAHDLASGLLDRRDELRGRFRAYRAKATRLGRAEDPELLTLHGRIQQLLWTKPSDLAAATRALAAYQLLVSGNRPGAVRVTTRTSEPREVARPHSAIEGEECS